MIVSIFLTILAIACILLVIGYSFSQENFYLVLIGYTFIFLLGIVLFTGGIDYVVGQNITESGSSTVIQNNYNSYTNNTVGIYLAIVSGFAFALTLYQALRGGVDNEAD